MIKIKIKMMSQSLARRVGDSGWDGAGVRGRGGGMRGVGWCSGLWRDHQAASQEKGWGRRGWEGSECQADFGLCPMD